MSLEVSRAVLVDLLNNVTSNVREYEYVRSLVKDTISLLSDEYTEFGGLLILPSIGNYVVVGDLHGDIASLKHVLDIVERSGFSEGQLMLILLGDYVDRGTGQLETIATLLEIKLRYSDKVFLLRGNHEPPEFLPVYPHDFPHELMMAYGIVNGRRLYGEFKELFQLLPRALIIRDVALLLHGGPPIYNIDTTSDPYRYLMGETPEEDARILEDILWNDPIESQEYFTESYRGAGHMFGPKITEAALRISGTRIVVRGHEPCVNGFKFNHSKRVLTLFSRLGPPYNNESAAILKLTITSPNEHSMNIITFSERT